MNLNKKRRLTKKEFEDVKKFLIQEFKGYDNALYFTKGFDLYTDGMYIWINDDKNKIWSWDDIYEVI